jgi:hypothetical protein
MAGKNKLETGFRFLWDTKDLSGDLLHGSFQGGGKVLDFVDLTGVSETVRNGLGGLATANVSARFHLNDASNRSFNVLKDDHNVAATLTLQWGSSGSAPTTGDPEWEGTYVFLGYTTSFDAGRSVMDCTWQPSGATPPAWGTYSA